MPHWMQSQAIGNVALDAAANSQIHDRPARHADSPRRAVQRRQRPDEVMRFSDMLATLMLSSLVMLVALLILSANP